MTRLVGDRDNGVRNGCDATYFFLGVGLASVRRSTRRFGGLNQIGAGRSKGKTVLHIT